MPEVIETKPMEESPPAAPLTPSTDPFQVDETRFASLSPEQRAALEPVLTDLKTKANGLVETVRKQVREEVKPFEEKAGALDELVKDPRFVQWWQTNQKAAMQGQSPQTQQAIASAQPQDFASAQEWAQAVLEASNGDPSRFQQIQGRMFAAMATPFVQNFQNQLSEVKIEREIERLFSAHPDAKELDAVGLDPQTKKGVSLLEMAFNWAEENKKSLEEGYQLARRWADSMGSKAKAEAMGLVTEKKEAVTSGPSSNQGGQTVIEVENTDELMRRSMEADLTGQKNVRFVLKKK